MRLGERRKIRDGYDSVARDRLGIVTIGVGSKGADPAQR